jgi:arginine-tRNA-protein transferase
VGYVDELPSSLSAIYFYYDPEERHRSLGTWNVLQIIQEARTRQRPYVYLGYFVAGCPSLEYKANFVPNEVREPGGLWLPFRT